MVTVCIVATCYHIYVQCFSCTSRQLLGSQQQSSDSPTVLSQLQTSLRSLGTSRHFWPGDRGEQQAASDLATWRWTATCLLSSRASQLSRESGRDSELALLLDKDCNRCQAH